MSVICVNCKIENPLGIELCNNCGADLPIIGDLSTEKMDDVPFDPGKNLTSTLPEYVTGAPKIGLFILSHQITIPLDKGMRYLIGRPEKVNTGGFLNINLTLYEGFDQGVSRLHATIKLEEDKIHIVDLDSSNGTYINESKLIPRQDYPITNGDTLRLGGLKIIVFIYDDEPPAD